METPIRILILEDVPLDAELIGRTLTRAGIDHVSRTVADRSSFLRELAEFGPDVILADYTVPQFDGLAALRLVRDQNIRVPFILVTGTQSEEVAVECMKQGADDYILKGSLVRLPGAVLNALERHAAERQREEALAALRASEERFQAFMNHSPALAFIKSSDGRYLYVNRAFERTFRVNAADVRGKTDADLWPAEIADRMRENDRAVFASAAPLETTETLAMPQGEVRTWLVYRFPIKKTAGEFLLGGLAKDVTEQRRLEDELRHSQKMEAMGRLAGGIAHDFNNLLSVIMGYAGLLLRRMPADDPLRPEVEEIRRASERATALTRQLLAFGRRQVLMPQILDLNTVVRDMANMLRRLIGEQVDLRLNLADGLGPVKADLGQIEQVIVNLVVNARDAMPHGGTLTIQTAEATLDDPGAEIGPCVMLAVSDTGVGIDPAILPRIFEPFFTTKPRDRGAGLGLSTVYGIVKQSGGHVTVQSAPGKGSTFRVYLPRARRPAERPRPAAPPPVSTHGTETILLVEDDAALRALTRKILELHGFTILEAGNADQAQTCVSAHAGPIHLLVTDVVLPDIDGRELARRLVHVRPDLRVLYISGYTPDTYGRRDRRAPEASLLPKPFTEEALVQAVRAVLDAPARTVPVP